MNLQGGRSDGHPGLESLDSDEEDEGSDSDSDDLFTGTTVRPCFGNPSSLSFKRILQHWAAYTSQKKSHLSYLLQLLKHYQPVVEYTTLPNTGRALMSLDSRDFLEEDQGTEASEIVSDHHLSETSAVNSLDDEESSCNDDSEWTDHDSEDEQDSDSSFNDSYASSENDSPCSRVCQPPGIQSTDLNLEKGQKKRRGKRRLLKADVLPNNGGKLMYFGVERGISGNSPGVMFKDADLFQYVNIHQEDKTILPHCLREKVCTIVYVFCEPKANFVVHPSASCWSPFSIF